MIQISWNCQGLGIPGTILYLMEKIHSKNSSMIFMLQTKMNCHRLNQIRRKCDFSKGFSVNLVGLAGGLSFGALDLVCGLNFMFMCLQVFDMPFLLLPLATASRRLVFTTIVSSSTPRRSPLLSDSYAVGDAFKVFCHLLLGLW